MSAESKAGLEKRLGMSFFGGQNMGQVDDPASYWHGKIEGGPKNWADSQFDAELRLPVARRVSKATRGFHPVSEIEMDPLVAASKDMGDLDQLLSVLDDRKLTLKRKQEILRNNSLYQEVGGTIGKAERAKKELIDVAQHTYIKGIYKNPAGSKLTPSVVDAHLQKQYPHIVKSLEERYQFFGNGQALAALRKGKISESVYLSSLAYQETKDRLSKRELDSLADRAGKEFKGVSRALRPEERSKITPAMNEYKRRLDSGRRVDDELAVPLTGQEREQLELRGDNTRSTLAAIKENRHPWERGREVKTGGHEWGDDEMEGEARASRRGSAIGEAEASLQERLQHEKTGYGLTNAGARNPRRVAEEEALTKGIIPKPGVARFPGAAGRHFPPVSGPSKPTPHIGMQMPQVQDPRGGGRLVAGLGMAEPGMAPRTLTRLVGGGNKVLPLGAAKSFAHQLRHGEVVSKRKYTQFLSQKIKEAVDAGVLDPSKVRQVALAGRPGSPAYWSKITEVARQGNKQAALALLRVEAGLGGDQGLQKIQRFVERKGNLDLLKKGYGLAEDPRARKALSRAIQEEASLSREFFAVMKAFRGNVGKKGFQAVAKVLRGL